MWSCDVTEDICYRYFTTTITENVDKMSSIWRRPFDFKIFLKGHEYETQYIERFFLIQK